MSQVGGQIGNNNLQMIMMKADGEKDRQSAASDLARTAMEAANPMNVLGGIAQIIKALGSISG